MTADVLSMQAEAAAIAARRADAIGRHPSVASKCPPHAALLHRVASLLTTEELPPASLRIDGANVHIDATGYELVQNIVRRYAAALELVVTEAPYDDGGFAGVRWSAAGFDGTGVWWQITGSELLPIEPPHDGFGVGLVNG